MSFETVFHSITVGVAGLGLVAAYLAKLKYEGFLRSAKGRLMTLYGYTPGIGDAKFAELYENRRKEEAKRRNIIYAMAAINFAIGIPFFFLQFHLKPPTTNTLEMRLQELDKAQTAVKELDAYITDQKQQLNLTITQVNELSKQKEQLEGVLSVDQTKVDELLQVANSKAGSHWWRDFILSFIGGIFASIIASTIYDLLKFKRSVDVQE